jgi:hypothetical protein
VHSGRELQECGLRLQHAEADEYGLSVGPSVARLVETMSSTGISVKLGFSWGRPMHALLIVTEEQRDAQLKHACVTTHARQRRVNWIPGAMLEEEQTDPEL